MTAPDELRPLPALDLLTIWRESRELAQEPLERGLLCNARVLAACCFFRGEPVFDSSEAVLSALTVREMETLLGRLSGAAGRSVDNPAFDTARFDALREA